MSADALVSASLLGAARLPTLPPAPVPEWQASWDAIEMEDPAARLLAALALARAAMLAGRTCSEAGEFQEPCEEETSDELSDQAVVALLRMLGGEFREVLPEWLEMAARMDKIAPPRVLPELMNAGARDRSLRTGLAVLVGRRGRWLARRHKSCRWVLESQAVDEEDWDADQAAERLAWFRSARIDEPEKAVAALTDSWAGESPDFRQSLVEAALESPQEIDAEWLEGLALKDRRQETRRLATAALIQLPGAFTQRAKERLRPLLSVEKKRLGRGLKIEPPAEFLPEWTVDGLKKKPPTNTGEKAWWLRQIVSMVPLTEWPELLGISSEDLFHLPIDSDWQEALLLGWIDSATMVPRQSMPDALLPYLAELKEWPTKAGERASLMAMLLSEVSNDGALLETIAKRIPLNEMIRLLQKLHRVPDKLGTKTLNVVKHAVSSKPSHLTRPEARAMALHMPLDLIPGLLRTLSRLPELSAQAEEFATTLEFRHKLFSESS